MTRSARTLHSLPLFVRLQARAVILLGEGEAADAKRRLLERAGAVLVGEDAQAALAIVAIEDGDEAEATVARLRARGVLVNAVDRPALCDFTLPAIVDRAPVLIAIGTGGVSAGLAAALRQRLEAVVPAGIGRVADALYAARERLKARYPDGAARRRALADAMRAGGALDLLVERDAADVPAALGLSGDDSPPGGASTARTESEVVRIALASFDPDDLTLRQARLLANADRVCHRVDVPAAILDRARADAAREPCDAVPVRSEGLTVFVEMR